MRVISLVPSWTETLIKSNIDVVGRTQFCIHPDQEVKEIPVVGGTKNWNWEKIQELDPDLLLLDREENPKFMSEQSHIPWHATHVLHIQDMPQTLLELSQKFSSKKLGSFSQRWESVVQQDQVTTNLAHIPGLIEWGRPPSKPIKEVLYLIWKDPWMVVGHDTFIGSVLNKIGIEVPKFSTKYPTIDLEDYDPQTTLLLFSSEPYPFLKKKETLETLPYPYAFVNGESFSWFGVRTLNFLEKSLNIK